MTTEPSRRNLLALATATGALAALPAFTASAAPQRPDNPASNDSSARDQLWWQAPADEGSMIEQGLPVGNGRLGALASNDPGRELLLVTDATMWTGGLNDTLDADGQFPYGRDDFGSFTLLARLAVDIPDHDLSTVSGYRRTLDLAQGVITTSYVRSGVTYRRQIFASHPDDAIVLHFTQSGGGSYTGTVTLEGTHGEGKSVSFGAAFPNGLRYGAAVTAYGTGGAVTVGGSGISFSGCKDLTVVLSGGTNYAPDAAAHYRDPSLDPERLGLWLDGNDPDWMGDYHTDINLQMNYWMADRAGLSDCFDAFTDYCVDQLPAWTELTRAHFNDPRNRYRNSTGKTAGWTVAISTNIHGGMGWWWHPAGNAWLCNSLWEHYEFTGRRSHLEKIYPLLKGACEFWEARLLTTTLPGTSKEILVADSDWSPEHGPLDAKGITYAQELVRALFGNYCTASAHLEKDTAYADTIAGLRKRLYLPQVSPTTGRLEEWMSPDNLGETTHRHLSPLAGLFPGDRIRPDGSTPADIVDGATALLTARGMESFGWANAWRSLCWARLKNADNAYQLVVNNLRPSTDGGNGTAPNLFDIYEVEPGRGIFQIDANLGTPAAMIEMLLYSRPGHLELLPALPDAWAVSGSLIGAGARGGFVVDLRWSHGKPSEARIRSIGGRTTTVAYAGSSRTVTLQPGATVTLKDFDR